MKTAYRGPVCLPRGSACLLRSLICILLMSLLLCACGQKTGAEGGTGNSGSAGANSENAAGPGTSNEAGMAGTSNASGAEAGGTAEPEETKDPIEMLEDQLKLAWNFLTEGNYKEAVLAFTAVLDIDPKNVDAYKGRAESYLCWAGETSDTETFTDYVNRAAEDYKMAAEYSEDANEAFKLEQARREKYNGLLRARLDEGETALAAGDREAMQQALRQGTYLLPYATDMEQEVRFGRLYSDCTYSVQDARDPGIFHSYCDFLMEMGEYEIEAGGRQDALAQLQRMLTGYGGCSTFTYSYIEDIDRPILDFALAHADVAEENVSIAAMIYHGSIALGDFDTAAKYFVIKNLHTHYPEGTTVTESGYTKDNGDVEQVYDACERILTTTIRWPNGGTSVTTYEYGGNDPRILAEHEVTSGGGMDPSTRNVTYTYANGQLMGIVTVTSNRSGTVTRTDEISYSGWDMDIAVSYSNGGGETELRRAEYGGGYCPR